MSKRHGTIFFGTSIWRFDPKEVDLSMPDDLVFEMALKDAVEKAASSPHKEPSFARYMSKNGFVGRNTDGLVRVKGEGWLIEYKTDEYIAKFERLKNSKEWMKFAELTQFDTVTEFNKTGKKP